MPSPSPLRPSSPRLPLLPSLRLSFSIPAPLPPISFFLFLIFRSSLPRFSLSNPSAFLLAPSSSSSLTTHGLFNISFRKALFSAQAVASSFVVRMIASEPRYRVSQSFLSHHLSGGGGRGRCRPTNPLQQHLLHLPERPHAPFHLDHGSDVHPAQIDVAVC